MPYFRRSLTLTQRADRKNIGICLLSSYFQFEPRDTLKVTAHSNNRNSKSSREVILGSVRLRQSVILRNYDMFSTDRNARYTARW